MKRRVRLDWRLFIPEEWDEDSEFNLQRRAKAKLPEDVHHIEKWRLALEMIDELIGWGIEPPVILGDGAYGDNTELRAGPGGAGDSSYVLDVKGVTSAYRGGRQARRSRRSPRAAAARPACATGRIHPRSKQLALAAGKKAAVTVTWREGTRGKMTSRFLALRVRPANIHLRHKAHKNGEELPACWLICEWPSKASRADQVLALQPSRRHAAQGSRPPRRSCAGGSSTTTASSKTRSASITSKAAPTPAGTTTSPSSSVAHAFLTLERQRRPPTRAAA